MNRLRQVRFKLNFLLFLFDLICIQNAINASNDEAGLQILKRYYCQLQLLRNRFPMLPETECAVRFTWYVIHFKSIYPIDLCLYFSGKMLFRKKTFHLVTLVMKKHAFFIISERCIRN